MISRKDQTKGTQKFILKVRALHEDFIYLQSLSDEIHLPITGINITLPEINLTLQKYHDAARDLERDLDEKQQNDFVRRENSLLRGHN